MSYTPLSYLSFSFFRSVFLASYPVFPFLPSFLFFLPRLSLSLSPFPLYTCPRACMNPFLSWNLLFALFLLVSISISVFVFVFHLPCNFPFADPLRIYPSLFISPLFLSFFLSFVLWPILAIVPLLVSDPVYLRDTARQQCRLSSFFPA